MAHKINNLEEFIQRIIEEKGLDSLDKSIVDQIHLDLMERLENRINATILAEMPEDKLTSFNELLESGSEEDIQKFCKENIANFDVVVATELLKFREVFIAS